jgi:hypothetical protein
VIDVTRPRSASSSRSSLFRPSAPMAVFRDFRMWPLADMLAADSDVRFQRGNRRIGDYLLRTTTLIMPTVLAYNLGADY